jgi:hypothetical protein
MEMPSVNPHAMTLRLPLTLAQSIADAADALGTNRSYVIRLFILRGLEQFSTFERPVIQRMQERRAHRLPGAAFNPAGARP